MKPSMAAPRLLSGFAVISRPLTATGRAGNLTASIAFPASHRACRTIAASPSLSKLGPIDHGRDGLRRHRYSTFACRSAAQSWPEPSTNPISTSPQTAKSCGQQRHNSTARTSLGGAAAATAEAPRPGFIKFDTEEQLPAAALDAMADRDILPGFFKPSHYNLSISRLEFKTWTYQGVVT